MADTRQPWGCRSQHLQRRTTASGVSWTRHPSIIVDGKAESVNSLIDKFIYDETGFRLWTDATGKFAVRARLNKKIGEQALLFTEEGRRIYVASDQLSIADREYLDKAKK